MIRTDYMALSQLFRDRITNYADTKRAVSLAVGVAVGVLLPMSDSPLTDATYNYDTVLVHSALPMFSEFNENIVINIDQAADTARAIWLLRHNCAFPDPTALAMPRGAGVFVEKLMNIGVYMNPSDQDYMNANAEVMIVLVNRIKAVLYSKPENVSA